jgi:hypothetical protein
MVVDDDEENFDEPSVKVSRKSAKQKPLKSIAKILKPAKLKPLESIENNSKLLHSSPIAERMTRKKVALIPLRNIKKEPALLICVSPCATVVM